MDQLTVSLGKNRRAKSWNVDYPTWEEFAARLAIFEEKEITQEEYFKMTPMQKADVKDGPAFVGGFIKGNRRTKDSVESRSMITLDADSIKSLDEFMFDAEMFLGGEDLSFVMYSTLSHRPNKPRLRVVIPLDQEVDADKHEAIARKVAGLIGIEYFDRTTFDVNRLMYLPTKLKDAETIFEQGGGQPLSVDTMLGLYDDWTDWAQWDRHPDEEQKLSHIRQKKGDPLEKQGAIGVFNRTYSISEAIDTFLSDKYEQCDVKDRYTFVGGSTAAGLVIYDDDTFATSNHSTDPISGQTVNAYDLVRIHKYGGMDEGTDGKGKIGKMPSDKAMKRLIDNDKGCKRTYRHESGVNAIAREFDGEDFPEEFAEHAAEIKAAMAEVSTGEHDPEAWADDLAMEDGEYLLTARNLELMLSHGPLEGVIAYSEFSNSYVMRRPAPWIKDKHDLENFAVGEILPWTSKDDSQLRHFMLDNYRIRAKELIHDAFIVVALQNKFHPIKDHIAAIEWDGQERAESVFIDMVGADDNHYTRQVTRKILLAAVTRLYEPGKKFDEMVILAGGQGIGKSTILEKLAIKDTWFNNSLDSLDSKTAGEQLQAGWIFEMSELSSMNKSESEEIKAFLSKRSDKYRPAYAKTVEEFPRKSVFFGTTNEEGFLKDQTGNRRFWIIPTYKMEKGNTLWDKLPNSHTERLYIDQLWAEVFEWYLDGEELQIDSEAHIAAGAMQEAYAQDNPLAEEIRVWINTPRPVDEWEDDEAEELMQAVCVKSVWHEFMGEENKNISWHAKRDISNALKLILDNDPDWRYMKHRWDKYGQQRSYVNVKY